MAVARAYHDVLVRLDLEHLENEAQEVCALVGAPVDASEVTQLHGQVHQRGGGDAEAALLPVRHLPHLLAHYLGHQELRVRAVHRVRRRVRLDARHRDRDKRATGGAGGDGAPDRRYRYRLYRLYRLVVFWRPDGGPVDSKRCASGRLRGAVARGAGGERYWRRVSLRLQYWCT